MVGSPRSRRRLRRALWLPVLYGLYLLLVGTFIAPELYAATGATLLAMALAWALHRWDCFRFDLRGSWARALASLPWRCALGLREVLLLLGRRLARRPGGTGRLVREPTSATARSRLGAGRRVALILLTSTPPSSVVLDVEREVGDVLLHRIGSRAANALADPEERSS